jgi:protein phosphatase
MIIYAKKTDKGKRRSLNEDYYYIPDGEGPYSLAIVADGIGGYQGGEVASQLAVRVFCAMVKDTEILNEDIADELLFDAMHSANSAILDYARDNEFYQGMGTTLVAALNLDNTMKIINIGDSRAYKYSAGTLCQITRDHSLVQELIESKTITKHEGRLHPRRNIITRALGEDMALAEIYNVDFDTEDIILLCSDGLTDMIDDDEILSIIDNSDYIEDMAVGLVSAANAAGGHDNITCVLIKNMGRG